jgi:RNA polymerase sigma-70 factor (ECF subfamily)
MATETVVPERSGADAEARVRAAVAEHFDYIWRLLARLGVPSSGVDDAAQEVFVVFARRLSDVRPGSERSFLYGSALRVASDARRAHARNQQRTLPQRDVGDPRSGPEELLAAKERLALLDRILDRMGEREREVFVLFELEELTTDETAALLGVPRGTVASRLRRARSEFLSLARRLRAQTGGAS